jgi:HKD family nuclease
MLNLVTNESPKQFQNLITGLLLDAEEIYIAVAFLKCSGLDLIKPYIRKGISLNIVAGVNFGITDPAALTGLLELSKKIPGLKPWLIRLDYKRVFHPKIYLVKNTAGYHVIIGSGNLTKGGLSSNHEAALYFHSITKTDLWDDTIRLFNGFIAPDKADPLGPKLIAQYRKYHKEQRAIKGKEKEFPPVSGNKFYHLEPFKKHLRGMDRNALNAAFVKKRSDYQEARQVLDNLIRKKHRPPAFLKMIEDLLGKPGTFGLWYSNGLVRHKGDIMDSQEAFCELVRTIKNGKGKTARVLFDEAKTLVDQIYGLGPNFTGELMLTYWPEKFANINQNPITVLREAGGLDIKARSNDYDGNDYAEYNAIVKEIADALGLKDMFEIDYFFNEIYRTIK